MEIGSAWSVWLHPKRASEELIRLRSSASARDSELDELKQRRSELEEDLAKSRELSENVEKLRSSLEREVAELKEINAEQAERIREWEEASEEMERVAGQLEKMVAMRDRMNAMRREYETKIAKLERQLWNSHNGGLQRTRPDDESPDIGESELLDSGDAPLAPPVPIKLVAPRPKINPPADDSDWLISLPD